MKAAQAELNKQKELLKSRNKDINDKVMEQRELQKEGNKSELAIKELEHKITKHQKDARDAVKMVQ